jgi:solute carrier family 12 (sodium/potassium/chloride transporter), member 2
MALNMYISLQFYNKWLSLFGCILCVVIMFMLSWQSSLITVGVIYALYLMVMYRQPDANWGSSTQEQTYRTMISAAHRLQQTGEHIKNYHPQILVLAGNPLSRPALIDLGHVLTKNSSLLMVGDVFETKLSFRARTDMINETYRYFDAQKIKGFYNLVDDIDMESGIKLMIQSSGFGTLSPNIVLMGYKNDWSSCGFTALKTYFKVLQ